MSGWVNFPRFRHVEVWDMSRKLMQIEYRVIEDSDHLEFEPCRPELWFMCRPYTLEVIVRSTFDVKHMFDDCICEAELDPCYSWGDRNKIGRYIYSEEGDLIRIKNDLCEITIRVWRDPETQGIRAEVVDQKVYITRPQWGRFWRRPKPLAA